MIGPLRFLAPFLALTACTGESGDSGGHDTQCADCGECGNIGGPFENGWIAAHPGADPMGDPALLLDWTPPDECADIVNHVGLLRWDITGAEVVWDVGAADLTVGGGEDLGTGYGWPATGVEVHWTWTDAEMTFAWAGPMTSEDWTCTGAGATVVCVAG